MPGEGRLESGRLHIIQYKIKIIVIVVYLIKHAIHTTINGLLTCFYSEQTIE